MALGFYFVDFSTGDVGFLPEASLPGGPPTGPAGGDLGGTYPNPTVDNAPDAALSANVPIMTAGVLPAVDGSLLTNLPGPAGAAGGDLGSNYPNPTVLSLAHVTTGPATYPAGSGVNITGLYPTSKMTFGTGTLDGSGALSIGGPFGGGSVLLAGFTSSTPQGALICDANAGTIKSTLNVTDAGLGVAWLLLYP